MQKQEESMKRFLQTLDDTVYAKLEKIATKRGVTVQTLIRTIIVPDWIEKEQEEK